jgi:hypothetical protein
MVMGLWDVVPWEIMAFCAAIGPVPDPAHPDTAAPNPSKNSKRIRVAVFSAGLPGRYMRVFVLILNIHASGRN